jgi:hypothetical protein
MKQRTKSPLNAPNDPEQSKRFIEAARKAEAEETKVEADRAFKKVAVLGRKDQSPKKT